MPGRSLVRAQHVSNTQRRWRASDWRIATLLAVGVRRAYGPHMLWLDLCLKSGTCRSQGWERAQENALRKSIAKSRQVGQLVSLRDWLASCMRAVCSAMPAMPA